MTTAVVRMLGIPAAWMTRCVALNAMPDQVDHRKATQCGLEICSTKVKNIRLLSDSARRVDANNSERGASIGAN